MTFREAFEALAGIADARGDTINLEVEAWHGPKTARSVVVQAWSSADGRHYRGSDYASVVAAYANREPEMLAIDAVIGAVDL